MKVKLLRYMSEVDKKHRKEYKLPDMSNIVSRNCNRLQNVVKDVLKTEEDDRLVPYDTAKALKEKDAPLS